MEKYDVIVIGGGPAGLTTAIYALRSGLTVALFESNMLGGQSSNASEIANYPGYSKISGAELALNMHAQAEEYGLITKYEEVIKTDLANKVIYTKDGEFCAECIVLCMGARPRLLNVKNEKEYTANGVHYCATCDGNFYRNKNVVVSGCGNTAVEDAIYLSNICKKVVIVCNKPKLNCQKYYIDQINKFVKNKKIEIFYLSKVSEIIAQDVVKAVVLDNGKKIKCDAVFVAIGREPNNDLIKEQLQLSNKGYVVANENTHTSIEGVFVAGDLREKALRQIATAVGDGAIAGTEVSKYINERRS